MSETTKTKVPCATRGAASAEVALSLGSNSGDRRARLVAAYAALAALPQTTLPARSPLYETDPVDVPPRWAGISFLNAIVVANTTLTADVFSQAIHDIEAKLGRRRSGRHHEPRVIDIDIIYFGALTSRRTDLTLPHPEWSRRRFVCQPLADVRPHLILPGQTATVAAILANLPPTPAVTLASTQW